MNWIEELIVNLAIYIFMMFLFADDSNLPMQIGKIATGSSILLVLKHQQEYRRKCVFILKLVKKQKLSWYKYIVQQTNHSIILLKSGLKDRNLDIIKQNKRFSMSFAAKHKLTTPPVTAKDKNKPLVENKLVTTLNIFSEIILGELESVEDQHNLKFEEEAPQR
jgi:hypothetical protein